MHFDIVKDLLIWCLNRNGDVFVGGRERDSRLLREIWETDRVSEEDWDRALQETWTEMEPDERVVFFSGIVSYRGTSDSYAKSLIPFLLNVIVEEFKRERSFSKDAVTIYIKIWKKTTRHSGYREFKNLVTAIRAEMPNTLEDEIMKGIGNVEMDDDVLREIGVELKRYLSTVI